MDEWLNNITKVTENEIFRNWKDKGMIENATLIMHPKYKWIFAEYKLDVDVLFTDICPEDKAYMVNDSTLKDEIKRNRAWFYKRRDNE